MRELRQVMLGILAAMFSAFLVLGSLSLTLSEKGISIALAPTRISPPPAQVVITIPAEGPSFIPSISSVILSPTETPLSFSPTPGCSKPADWDCRSLNAFRRLSALFLHRHGWILLKSLVFLASRNAATILCAGVVGFGPGVGRQPPFLRALQRAVRAPVFVVGAGYGGSHRVAAQGLC